MQHAKKPINKLYPNILSKNLSKTVIHNFTSFLPRPLSASLSKTFIPSLHLFLPIFLSPVYPQDLYPQVYPRPLSPVYTLFIEQYSYIFKYLFAGHNSISHSFLVLHFLPQVLPKPLTLGLGNGHGNATRLTGSGAQCRVPSNK